MGINDRKTDSELDRIIEKLGLEEVDMSEEVSEDSGIDLGIVKDEIKKTMIKKKTGKRLTKVIYGGGILILVMIILSVVLKVLDVNSMIGKSGSSITKVWGEEGTTSEDIDRPTNVVKSTNSSAVQNQATTDETQKETTTTQEDTSEPASDTSDEEELPDEPNPDQPNEGDPDPEHPGEPADPPVNP